MTKKPLTKILYAEDDPDIQMIARMSLETVGGYTLKICDDGNQALKDIAEFSPDLILLDVMMPNRDGPGTLEALRDMPEFATTPVVFMTAKVMKADIDDYKALGAVDVISKPFDPMKLPEQIKTIWESLDG